MVFIYPLKSRKDRTIPVVFYRAVPDTFSSSKNWSRVNRAAARSTKILHSTAVPFVPNTFSSLAFIAVAADDSTANEIRKLRRQPRLALSIKLFH